MVMDRRHVLTAAGATLAGALVLGRLPRTTAQEGGTAGATPVASPAATPVAIVTAVLIDRQQRRAGIATVSEGPDGQVTVTADIEGGLLEAGEYALVVHETGICEPSGDVPFSSAGGLDADGPSEALGTIVVEANSPAAFETTTEAVSLDALNDRDGTALVMHLAGDDVAADVFTSTARVACGVVYPPTETAAVAATPVAATPGATPAGATPAAEGTPVSEAAATEVTVEMVDIDFNPNEFTIPANTDVTVRLPNRGAAVHNFHIDPLDIHSEDVAPGEETTVTINAEPGDYEYYCSIPGHRQAGMTGTVHVE
jgi:Cu/Zn superoxide dismutase